MIDPHGEPVRENYRRQGEVRERERIAAEIERQICFDALADNDGRCSNHGGKCYELRQLITRLQGQKPDPTVELKLWMAKQTNLKEAARWQEFGEKVERERIIKLLEDSLYPLEYGRWQGDELLDEVFRLIKGEE